MTFTFFVFDFEINFRNRFSLGVTFTPSFFGAADVVKTCLRDCSGSLFCLACIRVLEEGGEAKRWWIVIAGQPYRMHSDAGACLGAAPPKPSPKRWIAALSDWLLEYP